jgi:hypothetical protein
MPFVKCKALATASVLAYLSVTFSYVHAQRNENPVTVVRNVIAPPPDQTSARVRSSVHCEPTSIPLDANSRILTGQQKNTKGTLFLYSQSLKYVVAQTRFSTEPLVMPVANFVVTGIAHDTNNHEVICPSSHPFVNNCPPSSQDKTCEIQDAFCVYDKSYDLIPYYSASSCTITNSASDSSSSNPPPCPAAKLSEAAAATSPPACPAVEPSGAETLPIMKDSQVPLAYRYIKPGSAAHTVMVPLRPFLQPNAASVTFSDQVGINGLPRWNLGLTAIPAWVVLNGHRQNDKGPLNYLSMNINVNLNNQYNANQNSTTGALQWNIRSRHPLDKSWFRRPGLDITLSGAEYDFVSNDVNLYYPSPSLRFPLAVLDKHGFPAVLVWKLQLGEISGYHDRDPSANLAGGHSVAQDIADEGSRLFRGVAGTTMIVQGWGDTGWKAWLSGFSINSNYQAMMPATDEPFTIPSSSSTKPPTVTLTDKTRQFVSSKISEKLGDSNFSLSITYQYGSLPPAFWLVKHSLSVGLTLSSGSSRTE